MKFKDQGPFGHWHEQYESIIDNFNEIDKIIAEESKEVMNPYLTRTVAPPLIIEYQNYDGHRLRIDREPLKRKALPQ